MIKNDVVIIGGGLIGLCLSYFLGKLALSVSIIDKDIIIDPKKHENDFRTTAISEGTKNILDNFGIWKKIKKNAEPINHISVIDRTKTNSIKFSNPKIKNSLGYIVENKFLKKILINELISNKKINLFEKSSISNIQILDNSVIVKINKKELCAPLFVAADGKNSFVRKILKQPFFIKKYNQNALVVNFLHKLDHRNIAYEIFYDSGPLATLPMLRKKYKKNLSSLVWSHNPNYINNLYKTNNNFLLSIIDEHVGKYLGESLEIINKQVFPLSATINSSFIDNRVVFVGDAAHSIHPIAGQGWNLGMRDINTLVEIINEAMELGIDIGSDFVCKQYQKMRYFDAFSLYQITDKLNSIFMLEGFCSKKTREIGFNIINNNNRLSKMITNYAMGIKL